MKSFIQKMTIVAALFVLMLGVFVLTGKSYDASSDDTPGASPSGAEVSPSGAEASPSPTTVAPQTTTTTNGPKIVWNSAAEGISGVQIKYSTEELAVTSSKKLYYAILKKESDKGAKQADLIPAANGGTGDSYLIDFSTISSSKEIYIGLATSDTPGTDGLVPCTNVSVAPAQRKIVFNIDWSVEGDEAKGNRIFSSVVVTNSDATTVEYVQTLTHPESQKRISELKIQWRKGANGAWNAIDALTSVQWESMKTSGAVVYFRLDAKDSGNVTSLSGSDKIEVGNRYGKENKVKISVTKASNIKLDVSKLTLAFKNGTQFRVSGVNDWITVLPYNASSTKTDSAIRSTSNKTPFDPYTENTQVKVSYLGIDEVKDILGTTAPAADQPIVLETRIAATIKKAASRTAIVTIPVQGEAPKAEIAHDGKQWTISGLTAADTTAPATFEYTIVKQGDITDKKLDLSMLKWASVRNGTGLKDTAKATYTAMDKSRRTVNITDTDAVILIRRRGVSPSSKSSAVLASKYLVLTVPTPAPSGTATPSPVPSGGAVSPTPSTAPTSVPSTAPSTAP